VWAALRLAGSARGRNPVLALHYAVGHLPDGFFMNYKGLL
jgi:hypothetical protein